MVKFKILMAREAGVHACTSIEPPQGKRQYSSREGADLIEEGSKKLRGDLSDSISAEAAVQPRQKL